MIEETLIEQKEFDPKYSSWLFNVKPHLKHLSKDQIREELKRTAFPYAAAIINWSHDFNQATLIRNANAFNAEEVFYLSDKKKYDRRGCTGVYHYTDVSYLSAFNQLQDLKSKYPIFVGVDTYEDAEELDGFVWPADQKFLVIFGSEGDGLQPEVWNMCEKKVSIKTFGSVPSLNCGVTSGIIFNHIVSQFKRNAKFKE